jgi:hypothetical protein
VAELKGKILAFRECHVRRLHQGYLSYDKTIIADVDAVLGDYTMGCITDVSEALLLPPSRHKLAM